MQLTTVHIINILPLDEEFKKKLSEKLPSLSDETRYEVVETLWDAYYALYEIKLQENTDKAFLRAANNQERLDKDFYKRVQEQTEKDMLEGTQETVTEVDLSETRQKLEEIVNTPSK
jgi:hypothetical protein